MAAVLGIQIRYELVRTRVALTYSIMTINIVTICVTHLQMHSFLISTRNNRSAFALFPPCPPRTYPITAPLVADTTYLVQDNRINDACWIVLEHRRPGSCTDSFLRLSLMRRQRSQAQNYKRRRRPTRLNQVPQRASTTGAERQVYLCG